jgi:uncharacterized SAM-dependent methyltransferase
MSFWTKSEAAKEFHVSPTTINNWIIATEKNKVNLDIATVGTKTVLVESEHNRKIIKQLIEKGKKHIGRGGRVEVEAKQSLYNAFSRQQLSEIISSLTSRLEIPYKFSYVDEGANYWDLHYRISAEKESNFVKTEHKLIVDNLDTLINRFKEYRHINLVDIGCGNGLPVFPIIEKLLDEEYSITYTALDISQKLIEIDKKELFQKFPNLNYKSFEIDFDRFNISDILILNKDEEPSANLLLYLGGTLGNQTDTGRIYANLRDSMGLNDFLVVSEGIAGKFPSSYSSQSNEYHVKRTTWILDALGLKNYYSESVFDIFDPIKKETTRKIEILEDITTEIVIDNKPIKIHFNQGDNILVFRFNWFKETEIIQQVVEHGFVIDQFNSNRDGTCALMIVRPKQV